LDEEDVNLEAAHDATLYQVLNASVVSIVMVERVVLRRLFSGSWCVDVTRARQRLEGMMPSLWVAHGKQRAQPFGDL
jgi:hypothetical protein